MVYRRVPSTTAPRTRPERAAAVQARERIRESFRARRSERANQVRESEPSRPRDSPRQRNPGVQRALDGVLQREAENGSPIRRQVDPSSPRSNRTPRRRADQEASPERSHRRRQQRHNDEPRHEDEVQYDVDPPEANQWEEAVDDTVYDDGNENQDFPFARYPQDDYYDGYEEEDDDDDELVDSSSDDGNSDDESRGRHTWHRTVMRNDKKAFPVYYRRHHKFSLSRKLLNAIFSMDRKLNADSEFQFTPQLFLSVTGWIWIAVIMRWSFNDLAPSGEGRRELADALKMHVPNVQGMLFRRAMCAILATAGLVNEIRLKTVEVNASAISARFHDIVKLFQPTADEMISVSARFSGVSPASLQREKRFRDIKNNYGNIAWKAAKKETKKPFHGKRRHYKGKHRNH